MQRRVPVFHVQAPQGEMCTYLLSKDTQVTELDGAVPHDTNFGSAAGVIESFHVLEEQGTLEKGIEIVTAMARKEFVGVEQRSIILNGDKFGPITDAWWTYDLYEVPDEEEAHH